ncbi:MAG: hypothetical protein GX799_11610 [Crenarchaeota archaeon]|nr:hypothetical protein [Thermoproteota archaeon]
MKNGKISFSKKKNLFITTVFILSLLTISATYSGLMPTVYAQPTSEIQQQSFNALNTIFGLDMEKYSIEAKAYPKDNMSVTYLNLVSQENIAYSLTSENSKLTVQYTYGNNKLQMIQVLGREGTPNLIKAEASIDHVENAKKFLNSYQNYTNNKLFGNLISTLSNVDMGKNITKVTGDIALEMISFDDYTNFKWYYTANGVEAPYTKYVTLGFEGDFLAAFVDNWQFFNIGSTNVNLSEEEAITIAIDAARNYAHTLKLDDYAFNEINVNQTNICWASLLFDHSLNASKPRSADALELYPTWKIGVVLDKWYGSLYGIEVDIWADTREVRGVHEAWSTVPAPEGVPTADINVTKKETNQQQITEVSYSLILWVALMTIVMSTATTSILVYKKKQIRLESIMKAGHSKTLGILLCILTLSIALLAPLSPVSAWSKTGIVWGSESSGADQPGYASPNDNWRKSYNERVYQRDTSVYLTNWFQEGGFYAYNHQGHRNPGSTKTQILNNDINLKTADSSRVAFVTFDHGVGNYINGQLHFMFEDQTGTGIGSDYPNNYYWDPSHGIYDEEIYNAIDDCDRGKTTLAFINTCLSASLTNPVTGDPYQGYNNGRALGIPYAFTHREVKPWDTITNIDVQMSNDGFSHPDDGSQVFIGFPRGSASLEQGIPYGGGGGNPYYWWVVSFFYHAVALDESVIEALNAASNQFIGGPFLSTPLHTGFAPIWWNMYVPPEWSTSTLEIYGNGRIHLKAFGDDFTDGNYNGWTVNQGSWTASSGILRAQQGLSLIRTNDQFSNDRHVRVQVRTITAGADTWDTAWVIAKHDSQWNNMAYALIHTNGYLEFAIYRNWDKVQWSVNAGLNPFNTNTIDIDIIGTKAYVWVNGHLHMQISHAWLDDFAGSTAMYTHYSSTAEFDDITVIKQ